MSVRAGHEKALLNPSGLAGWPSGLLDGHNGYENVSSFAECPSTSLMIECGAQKYTTNCSLMRCCCHKLTDRSFYEYCFEFPLANEPLLIEFFQRSTALETDALISKLQSIVFVKECIPHVRKSIGKRNRYREPSRVCFKELNKILHSKSSCKRLKAAVNVKLSNSSFIKSYLLNYKQFCLRFLEDSYYSKYVFFLRCKFTNKHNKCAINKTPCLSQNNTNLNHSLRGGMYARNASNANTPFDILRNKLGLIGRVPYECGSSSGDCFFASLAHGLYSDPGLHFEIRSAGIAHMISNLLLYIESLANKPWENYINEMSQQGTWCDNLIIQAVANALSCTIHITDSNPTTSLATIITPVRTHCRQRIVSLGYI